MAMGKVYLVGAGPGDPSLITVRGQQLLRRADVVVYDHLIDEHLLTEAPRAEHIYAGNAHDGERMEQDELNRLLIDFARAGKSVIRLKGGDPYLFGRGGEEAQALRAAGIPFEVVPGVTSAFAVPAYAGIPVTHRDYASSVTVITGHEQPAKIESSIEWEGVAKGTGTLVLLMAMTNLEAIVRQLIEHGRPADTPCAIVRWGTRPDQTTVVGPLRDIARLARETGMKAPAVVVVGEVVGLRAELNWFEELPLFGIGILVTRARAQASVFSESLRQAGAVVYQAPLISFAAPDDLDAVDRAIERISEYDWLIFTSANGVGHFCDRVWSLGYDARIFNSAQICAIGPETARSLKRYGLRADIVPQTYVAEAIVDALSGSRLKRVLIPRAKQARDLLPRRLREQGAQVDVLEVYRTEQPRQAAEKVKQLLAERKIDVVTFTSSSTVTNFLQIAPELPPQVKVACIGPITRQTAEERGLKVDIVAESYTTDGLKDALVRYYAGGMGDEG